MRCRATCLTCSLTWAPLMISWTSPPCMLLLERYRCPSSSALRQDELSVVELRMLTLTMLVCNHTLAPALLLKAQCVRGRSKRYSHVYVVLYFVLVHSLPAHQLLITSKLLQSLWDYKHHGLQCNHSHDCKHFVCCCSQHCFRGAMSLFMPVPRYDATVTQYSLLRAAETVK